MQNIEINGINNAIKVIKKRLTDNPLTVLKTFHQTFIVFYSSNNYIHTYLIQRLIPILILPIA